MNKHEITSKIKEITETGAVCGVDVYVCLKGEEQEFYIEKMISMNSLKDRIRSIALEIINTQYLQDEVVYCDILDVIDNKKAVYVLEQSDEYKPFALLNDDSMDEVFNFDEKDIGNVATLKEYQTGEKLTISKKLMKVKNSPVLAMDKDELINKIPLVPRYKNIIHIENGKIRTNTKKDVDNLMKLLNDDYVKSELTDMEYDSTSKTLLNSESQDE